MDKKKSIKSFLNNLSVAVYDKELEINGSDIKFFLDADIVLKLVLGFQSDLYNREKSSTEQNIIRSLFSLGCLGEFYLLRPHAFEFYEKIKNEPDYSDTDRINKFRKDANKFIEEHRIKPIMDELLVSLRRSKDKKENKYKGFLDTLKDRSLETISLIEQLNGSWQQRLRRLYDKEILSLKYLGPETSEIILKHEDDLYIFYDEILKCRPELTINSFQDATALMILSLYIDKENTGSWLESETPFIVRFYSETQAIIDLFYKNKIVQESLRYKSAHDEIFPSTININTIFRGPEYFVIRTMFKELSPNNKEISNEDLKPLKDLVLGLNEIFLDQDIDITELLRETSINGFNLESILENYEKYSLIQPLWVENDPTEVIIQLENLENWKVIFEFVQNRKFKTRLNEQIEDIRNEFEFEVSRIRQWNQDLKRVLNSYTHRIKEIKQVEKPQRDLGLIRWNVITSKKLLDEFNSILTQISDSDHFAWMASKISTRMELARRQIEECIIITNILWALELYEDIDSIINSARECNPKKFPIELSLFQLAARIRSNKQDLKERYSDIKNKLEDIEEKNTKSKIKDMALSIGYIYYHLWRLKMVHANFEEKLWKNQSNETKSLARKSFNYGKVAAMASKDKNDLKYAYALNHCTYVGVVTDYNHNETLDFFNKLSNYGTYRDSWASRFDDTVGYYYLARLEKDWHTKPREELLKDREDIRDFIITARRNFKRAIDRDPGDIDIDEHINRLNIIEERFNDLFDKSEK